MINGITSLYIYTYIYVCVYTHTHTHTYMCIYIILYIIGKSNGVRNLAMWYELHGRHLTSSPHYVSAIEDYYAILIKNRPALATLRGANSVIKSAHAYARCDAMRCAPEAYRFGDTMRLRWCACLYAHWAVSGSKAPKKCASFKMSHF